MDEDRQGPLPQALRIFLSHSSADKPLARRLARDLRESGVDVWLDQWEIGVGDSFAPAIEQALADTRFVVVLLTRASVGSGWVEREWRQRFEMEVATRRIGIIPVRAEPCAAPDFLAQRSHADISGGSYAPGLRQLLGLLGQHAQRSELFVADTPIVADKDWLPSMELVVRPITVLVGADLIRLFVPDREGRNDFFDVRLARWQTQLLEDFGFRFPPVHIFDQSSWLPGAAFQILIEDLSELTAEVADAEGAADAATQLIQALDAVVRGLAGQFVDPDVARSLIELARQHDRARIDALLPLPLSWAELCEVLRRLVDEHVSVADLSRILEALHATADLHEMVDTVERSERVRHALRDQITRRVLAGRAALPVWQVASRAESAIRAATRCLPSGVYVDLEPEDSQRILADVEARVPPPSSKADMVPLLVDDALVRPMLRRLVSQIRPGVEVLSRADLAEGVTLRVMGQVGWPPGSKLEPSPHDDAAS